MNKLHMVSVCILATSIGCLLPKPRTVQAESTIECVKVSLPINSIETSTTATPSEAANTEVDTTEAVSTVESIPETTIASYQDLGDFKITAYCACAKCCGKNAKKGITRTGTKPQANHTISVDPKIIPLGTTVYIDGCSYVAEDTGSGIHGKKIDMYFNTHQEALNFGVQHKHVQLLVQ